MIEDEDGRSLPVLPYPKGLVQRAFHLLRHLQRNFRRQWERRPKMIHELARVSTVHEHLHRMESEEGKVSGCGGRDWVRGGIKEKRQSKGGTAYLRESALGKDAVRVKELESPSSFEGCER